LTKIKPPQFSKPDGLNATVDDENADILKNHFQAVFDRRDVTTYETVIDDIQELNIAGDLKEELRSIPEIEEVKKASDMLKALPEKALEHLTLIIQKVWKGEEDH
jgi:uncharacterized protein with gpF-like domain